IAGLGSDKNDQTQDFAGGGLNSSNRWIDHFWETSYERIALANNFLENVPGIEMDENKKAMMLAEARFWRAYTHFNLGLYFGNVPIVTEVLSIEEANSVTQSSQEQVINFAEQELEAILEHLPVDRPLEEMGRVSRGAALGFLGRIKLYQQEWSEAADVFKRIIDSGVYSIDPRFREIFWEIGETSPEHILAIQYATDINNSQLQKILRPSSYGGFHQYNVHHRLVDTYLMTDGLPSDESPLYDPENPYDNRDPRLLYTVLIPEVSTFAGQLYVAHPDSTNSLDRVNLYNWTGYTINKYLDENYYPGNRDRWGGNWTLIRYAEVLLGYLEAMLESGAPITQELLDLTINQLRGREAVDMPFVTETNPSALREIVRRERVTELAMEGVAYYDLLRYGNAAETIRGNYYGMKVTNDPENYTLLPVNDEGYMFYAERNFRDHNTIWPIPQTELDINPNLVQNPGYQ
ncbi:MAG TPA: RagB/SusD family nutrient uptake outer membrane protein, partial [Mariniphaga sp.]|nr:RagB/SusD family nutrient uptake outer membrane protein [Mariniphaga sp.]